MRLNLLLATRNLLRNFRRTLLSLSIIALGTAMSFSVRGYVDDALFNIRNGVVQQYGNFQIASPLLFDQEAQGYEYLLAPEKVEQIQMVLAAHPQVTDSTTEVNFSALASFGRQTKVIRATATRPGNTALDYNGLVVAGRPLEPDDLNAVLIGQSMADQRNLKPGDAFRINLSTVDGAYNVGKLKVAGIFTLNNAQFEGQLVFVPIDYAQAILNTTGVGKVIVSLDDLEDTDRVAQAVQAELNRAGLGLEVKTWYQLSDFFRTISGFFNAIFLFLTLTISVLVFFIVLQVLTLSFLERTREVGTVRALGTRAGQVFSMFLSEGALLGVLGSTAGLLLGGGIALLFNALQIGWRPPGALDPVPVRLAVGLGNAWFPFLVSALATVVSAVFPSLRSSRRPIVDALRTR